MTLVTHPVYYHEDGFPPTSIRYEELIPHIGPASAAVARYDGTLAAIPNATVLLSPLITREAVLSSKIEGTQATMGEVLEYDADVKRPDLSQDKIQDIREILNYRIGMQVAKKMLETLPLSLRVIREIHRELLQGVRGHGKSPGELRRIPNWIGPPGCTIDHARFVPISADKLPGALSKWERYIHDETPDLLIQLAILHAEFEALHPFLDGNGRLGRMLIPLFLWQKQLLREPMFYMSAYFEANREDYYDHLLAISRDNDWTGWCKFFLIAIRSQAQENQEKATAILKLYSELKPSLIQLTRSQYAIHALDWMFEKPIFSSRDFIDRARIPGPTARRMLTILKTNGILSEVIKGEGRRAAVYGFPRLLNIAEGSDVF